MSRASEITLFLILLQASVGFVDATGMFSEHYIDVPSNNASYTIQDLSEYSGSATPSIVDEIMLVAHWMIEGFFIGIKIIFTIVFVFPTLVSVFNIPAVLSIFIQTGVYYVYAIWYAQFKSGKGWKQYE